MGSVWPSDLYTAHNNLASNISGITIANGYQSDVVTVLKYYDTADYADPGKYPCIFVYPSNVQAVPFDGPASEFCGPDSTVTFNIFASIYVDRYSGETNDTGVTDLLKLEQDIKAVVFSDPTLTVFDSLQSYESEIVFYRDQNVHSILITLIYLYRENPVQ